MSRSEALSPALAWEAVPGGSGPVMLMIHGMLSSRLQWADNTPALLERCRPVLVELWGHGSSPSPRDASYYSVSALVAAIDGFRASLGVERVLLCTQSFGAGLGLHYCLQHPDRVIAHVFTNSISAVNDPHEFERSGSRRQRLELIREHGVAGLAKMPFHPRNARRLDPALQARLVEIANATDVGAFAALTENTRPDLSVAERLHEIRCPTLLVNGRFEKRFQPLRDRVAERLPGVRIVDLEAGHAVNLEQAAQFNDAVLSFLASLPIDDVLQTA